MRAFLVLVVVWLLCSYAALLLRPSHLRRPGTAPAVEAGEAEIASILGRWPRLSRDAVRRIMADFGPPSAASPEAMRWTHDDLGIVVYRDPDTLSDPAQPRATPAPRAHRR